MESTMLIVDDSEMNREILTLLFRDTYEILEAEDGREALAILESCKGHIDVVLLDLFMENMGGMEVLKKRKHLDYFRNVPVVIITSSNMMEDQVEAFKLGASDWINKPFIPEIVCSRVNNVMASRRRLLSIEMEAEKMKVKSEIDQMTGLLNKITAEQTIEGVLTRDPEKNHVLLVIDIDNFKVVNDLSGHQAGDHTIRIIADLISSLFRKSDVVGRIGGDEYVVLMVAVPSMDIVRAKVNELIQTMKYKPNLTLPENVSVSVGFASSNGKETTYSELFKKADEALYQAKEEGKARAREAGVPQKLLEDDDRYTVLLLSRNRSICSIIHAMMPMELRIVEILDKSDLAKTRPEDVEKMVFSCIDATEYTDDSEDFWKEINSYPWLSRIPAVAVCEEGNMFQYQVAITAGVDDILSFPIDSVSFKRRMLRQLERVKNEKGNSGL